MKILKIVLYGISGLIALFLVVAFFAPRQSVTSRTVSINAPQGKVFGFVNSTQKQYLWSPWKDGDPKMKNTFDGPETGVGNRNCWQGNDNVGVGCQTIMSVKDSSEVGTVIDFKQPFESRADASIVLKATSPTVTAVTWSMKFKTPYPFNLFSILFDAVGPDFEKGLGRLKAVSEQ